MKPLFSQKFAILTAENPRYGSAEGGNAALEQEMKTKGLKFTPMKGKYGVPENSYLVENPDHQDILSWGKKYGQDSVIVSDGGHHKMVYTNGPHEGLWHEGHSVSVHDKEPEDFYSTINLNDKPTHFTIEFDMDTKHGAPIKKSLTKMLKSFFTLKLPLYSEYVEPLEKSEKLPHFLKFMGDHPKAQETAQWADDNLKHRNLAELAMRHAKTKPEGLNEEEKTHIKHFNDSLHMPEVQKAAGMLGKQHDFQSGINILKEAEATYQKRHAAEAPTLVPTEGIKVLDFGDGVGVYRLPLDSDGKNENEATAMGHCATPHKGGQLWSIRRDHGNGMVEPLVTISHEGGYIGEMKGKHNWKPSEKHHIHIAKLLASNKIKGFVGGGYAPESNFEISDLKEGLRKKLLEHKPSLTQEVYKETLPRGFQGDYSHVPEIKSIFNTNNLEAQKKYLQKFSKNTKKHIEIRSLVAQSLSTHPDILSQLSNDSDDSVRYSAAKNPNIHPEILRKLSTDRDFDVRESVAQNPNAHPDILRELSTDFNYNVRKSVAQNPNTPPDILHKLLTDEYFFVSDALAENPKTPPDILHKLTDKSYLRRYVARNPNTHPDTLRKLSTDNEDSVRYSVTVNHNTHPDILRQLSADNHPEIRQSVAKKLNTHPDILRQLSNDGDPRVRESVAKNPNTHPDILSQLSNDSDYYVCKSVAQNPQFKNLPLEIQQNVRPLINTNIQKIIAMINDGERNPDAASKATAELRNRREEKYDRILSPEGNLSDIQHLAESHDEDIAKRAREELKRRGLQKSLKKSDSPKHLIHFSTTPNLTTLDPEFQGTAGRHSPETKHGKPTHPRVYFYEEGTPTESVVTGGAKSKYIVKHPGHDKIIDIANDLENQQQAKQQWSQKPIGSMQDAYFKLLKDKGYLGFKNSASALPNVVALFHATPVHAEVPAPKDMAANPDWTKAEIPMSLKKSDVKEAVEKIKGPAKVSDVLAEAKPDMRAKILAALRKEKLAKMNGTGVSGAGGATPPMMAPAVPAAPAAMAAPLMRAEESESHMAKKDLKDIMEYAQALDKMVVESEDLEDWVDSKITVARQYLSDIAHYLSYEHGQPTEELDKGDVISMKDKKVISTDTKPAPKELVAQQPKMPKIKRAPVLIQTVKLAKAEEDLEKGDVVSMKDKKVISTDTKPASKTLVAKQPTQAVYKRGTELAIDSGWKGAAGQSSGKPDLSLVKSDSKKAKFERCVLAVKKKSGDKVNPWAVCHASVDGAKKSEDLEKADMKVKEQEKPTKGMPQAKQLKADADLEKIKEGAENVAKATDKKKSELSKSEELEKGKNVRQQREAVFGALGNKKRKLQLKIINDFVKKHFGIGIEQIPQDAVYNAIRAKENQLISSKAKKKKNNQWTPQDEETHQQKAKELKEQRNDYIKGLKVHLDKQGIPLEDVLGKKTKAGHYVNKPSMSNPRNNLQHTGTPDSIIHEIAHLIYHGVLLSPKNKNVDGSLPHFQQGFQQQLDNILGDIQKQYGYGQQWRTVHESVPLAIEQKLRRFMGLPAHQKKASPSNPQKQWALDVPNKKIVHEIKDPTGKTVWLSGKTANIPPNVSENIDKILTGELSYTSKEGFKEGTSIGAKIGSRARAASKDKTRKDADTLMRSDEVLEKKLILGEGKPSKATKKATPEEHKAIMDKLSAALDTVKVDQSEEAQKERKMLLEHVKRKLKRGK